MIDSDDAQPLSKREAHEQFFTLKQRGVALERSAMQVKNVVMRYEAGLCVVTELSFTLPPLPYLFHPYTLALLCVFSLLLCPLPRRRAKL